MNEYNSKYDLMMIDLTENGNMQGSWARIWNLCLNYSCSQFLNT